METKKYLDLEGLETYHEKLMKLHEKKENELKEFFFKQLELGKLGAEEEGEGA